MVYIFSDGYKDQFGLNNCRKFMSKKFTQLLVDIHQMPLSEQQDILDKTIEERKGASSQTDDILVMGVKLEPKLAERNKNSVKLSGVKAGA